MQPKPHATLSKTPRRPGTETEIHCVEAATRRALGTIPVDDPEATREKIAAAREAQRYWARTSFADRRRVLAAIQSALIERDIDVLADMAKRNLVVAAVSVTTLDRRLANTLEPRAATPEKRLGAIRALKTSKIPRVSARRRSVG